MICIIWKENFLTLLLRQWKENEAFTNMVICQVDDKSLAKHDEIHSQDGCSSNTLSFTSRINRSESVPRTLTTKSNPLKMLQLKPNHGYWTELHQLSCKIQALHRLFNLLNGQISGHMTKYYTANHHCFMVLG